MFDRMNWLHSELAVSAIWSRTDLAARAFGCPTRTAEHTEALS